MHTYDLKSKSIRWFRNQSTKSFLKKMVLRDKLSVVVVEGCKEGLLGTNLELRFKHCHSFQSNL
jgi:hypothetical protein